MPAPEGDVTLGIAQVKLPDREGLQVEVRLEPDAVEQAARLGAEAILTVVFEEAGTDEVIARVPVRFARDGAATRRFSVAGRAVKEVTP
jgi:Ca-activated chloride channel family protein